MRKANPKIEVNQEDRVLSIQLRRGKGVESDMEGNAVIDYDRQGRIVRINLYDIDFDTFREQQGDLKNFAKSAHINIAFQ